MSNDKELYIAFKEYVNQYKTHQHAADALGVSRSYVTLMLLEWKPISEEVARKIGYVKRVTWERVK